MGGLGERTIAPRESPFVRSSSGYWMSDVLRLCKGPSKDWSALQAACLHSTIFGARWIQDRLCLAGFLEIGDFTSCIGVCRGTLGGRHWICKTLRNERDQGIGRDLKEEALATLSTRRADPLWLRGLMCKSQSPALPSFEADTTTYFSTDSNGIPSGFVYTGGAMAARWC